MRLTEEQIKQAILHEDVLVRSLALDHFCESFSEDPSVMPHAIHAVEKYGWKDVVHHYHSTLGNLALTAETAAWVVQRLERREESATGKGNAFRNALLASLLDAPIDLLQPLRDRILRLDLLEDSPRELLDLRFEWSTKPPQACWDELESLAKECASPDREAFPSAEIRRAEAVISVFAPRSEGFADLVLELLAPKLGEDGTDPRLWLQGMMIILAGRMRLAGAAPLLVQRLYDDWDWYSEECQESLKRIGGQAALDAICDEYASAPWHVRLFAAGALEASRAEEATQRLTQLLELERGFAENGAESSLLLSGIGSALVHQFETSALHIARELINEYEYDSEVRWIRREFIAASLMLDEPIPEFDEWKQAVERELRREQSWYTEGPHFAGRGKRLPDAPSIFDAAEDAGGPLPTAPLHEPRTAVAPITRTAARVGRNDPCPCGSGKKYKKCCLRRESATGP